jgi:hypothetical protein
MARICFHALIITGNEQKANQNTILIGFWVMPFRLAAERSTPLKKPTQAWA